ncbi:MAG TPA: hypothetical protein VKU02_11775 [Gemmataceae bacterium]|nr:hypothetical protein [Gemmataceae bacterium]
MHFVSFDDGNPDQLDIDLKGQQVEDHSGNFGALVAALISVIEGFGQRATLWQPNV